MNIKNITASIVFLLNVALIFSGCNRNIFDEYEQEPIRFACDSVSTTRGTSFEQAGVDAIRSMGVYAAVSTSAWDGNTPFSFMQNQKIERTDATKPWEYTPQTYWPSNGKVTFFAYAPHNAAGLTVSGTQGIPQIEFNVNPDYSRQVDLLVSSSVKDQIKTSAQGKVDFQLAHALSRVSFGAKVSTASTESVIVTSVELINLYASGTSTMEAVGRNWTLTGTPTASYAVTTTNGGLDATKILNTDYQTINSSNGYLFLMPQTIADDAKIVINYTVDGTMEAPITLDLAKALSKWQPGEALRFLINLDVKKPFNVELSYIFTAWTSQSTDISIDANPYLYVSETITNTYDAAATRVYFYTNQPAASVKIDAVGRLSSVNGDAVNVDDKFYALTGPDKYIPTMKNFFYDQATGKGYFDLVNVIRVGVVAGNQTPVLLRLRAGKLDQYITVKPLISSHTAQKTFANTVGTGHAEYVATFHKRNEIGERIVTWFFVDNPYSAGGSGSPTVATWVAEVDKVGDDYNDLIIDRLPSPDYKVNLLYTTSPRDAEGANVNEGTRVEGRGRIYIRVGWKTPSPNKNRYARIKIVSTQYFINQGTSQIITAYVYCRQGEEPDTYTYTGYGSTTAVKLPKFSPYNLASDGALSKYPSQGGLVSQWGRPASWLLDTKEAPAGYPTGDITEPIDPQVAICPDGYKYPMKSDYDNLLLASRVSRGGYCADGYFDRRPEVDHKVAFNSVDMATMGSVFSHPNVQNSATPTAEYLKFIFIPATSYRNETGIRTGDAISGMQGLYWTVEENSTNKTQAYSLFVNSARGGATVDSMKKQNSALMRCIKMDDPVVLTYDSNGAESTIRSTTGDKNTNFYIPRKTPKNYWRFGYFFNGWNKKRDGSDVDRYLPGTMTPTAITNNTVVYAVWSPFLQVDLSSVMLAADYAMYSKTDSYNSYIIGANGAQLPNAEYSTLDDIKAAAAIEAAHYHLRFHNEVSTNAVDWVTAYTACKALTTEGRTWRLPRAAELMLFSQNTPLQEWELSELFEAGAKPLWTGTESTTMGNAFQVSYYNSSSVSTPKTNVAKYRCVSEF